MIQSFKNILFLFYISFITKKIDKAFFIKKNTKFPIGAKESPVWGGSSKKTIKNLNIIVMLECETKRRIYQSFWSLEDDISTSSNNTYMY